MEIRERNKIYIVIGLLIIFFAVGYFRFLHGKITFFSRQESGVAFPAASEVPVIDLKGVTPGEQPQKKASEAPRRELRDIFAPAKTPPMTPSITGAAVMPKPLPDLKLMGTIIGGKRPMAVINGQFLRKGETIAGFEVVSIARNSVTLSGGGRKVLLNILTGAEERSP